jgi:hypothetical protein
LSAVETFRDERRDVVAALSLWPAVRAARRMDLTRAARERATRAAPMLPVGDSGAAVGVQWERR